MPHDLDELIAHTKLRVVDRGFVLIGLSTGDGDRFLRELNERADLTQPFMLVRDEVEFTALISESTWAQLQFTAPSLRIESGFRLLTLDIELAWDVVGFLAHVTQLLAAVNISVGVLSSFSRDHLLIKHDQLGAALRILNQEMADHSDGI